MAEHAIPVDLFNPGQVFACMGFLEAADILLGDAEGAFDWRDEGNVKFCLNARGNENPFKEVLAFLSKAEIIPIAPSGVEGPWPDEARGVFAFPAPAKSLKKSDGKRYSVSALPIELRHNDNIILVSHWLKRGSEQTLKLFAGNQVAAKLVANMIQGDKKKKSAKGFRYIYENRQDKIFQDPFACVCEVGGRFGFDARGSWDAIRIGSSLDKQGNVLVEIAPHIELLAAIGLENTRPIFESTYQIRYAVWSVLSPISLCRVAIFSPEKFLAKVEHRFFHTHLGQDKQYKKVFFANEDNLND